MKMKTLAVSLGALTGAALCLSAVGLNAAAARPAQDLFAEEILAKGKGIKITRSQVDEAIIAFKANMAGQGRAVPEAMQAQLEAQMLERLLATQLLMAKATEEDKARGKEFGEKFFTDLKARAGSDEAFNRQLLTTSMKEDQVRNQVIEQAIVKEVIDREIKSKQTITDEQIKKYYDSNPERFDQPELVRVSHILFSTVDQITGQPLEEERKKEKKEKLAKLLERARAGEDFTALTKEFSEDPGVKENNGEYRFARAKDDPRRPMVPEFEVAAFALATNQVSDIVTTPYGFHIIKLHEKTPAQKLELAKVANDIKEALLRQEVEKQLEPYVEQLKKEAGVETKLPKPAKPDAPRTGDRK
ncbi:MAG: peptidylprolyl isomerase [Pedosphaera parvula]|nr:peptidylprolyl isomerase [Pedosphaera parvula]